MSIWVRFTKIFWIELHVYNIYDECMNTIYMGRLLVTKEKMQHSSNNKRIKNCKNCFKFQTKIWNSKKTTNFYLSMNYVDFNQSQASSVCSTAFNNDQMHLIFRPQGVEAAGAVSVITMLNVLVPCGYRVSIKTTEEALDWPSSILFIDR